MLDSYIQLFVNGLPVEYSMIIKGPLFIFEPGYNPHDSLIAPKFTVKEEEDKFHFEDLDDDSLKDQVEEEILAYIKARNN